MESNTLDKSKESILSGSNTNTIDIDPAKFLGIVDHQSIFERIVNSVTKSDFKEILGMPDGKDLKQKHMIVAVVKNLFEIADAAGFSIRLHHEKIYIYNGCFWKPCVKQEIKALLHSASIKMGVDEYEAHHYEFLDKLCKQFYSTASTLVYQKNTGATLINLKNGTFEFKGDQFQLKEFDPKDFLTFQLPFSFNNEAQHPLFSKFLDRVLPDTDCQRILQEFFGYIFSPLNLEKCLIVIGGGANGKSVVFNILNALLGEENVLNFSLGLFNHEYNRSCLRDALVNYSSEKGFDLAPDIFKILISGEPIHAREPYGTSFTIRNRVRFISNCNELPNQIESTDAFFRRFIILPFDVKIPESERDVDLAHKIIRNELPGVFNWLLEGLKRLNEQRTFTQSSKVNLLIDEFRSQSDSVELFLKEYNYRASYENRIPLWELYSAYKQFCRNDNYRIEGKIIFSNHLRRKGFDRARTSDGSAAFLMESINIEENDL